MSELVSLRSATCSIRLLFAFTAFCSCASMVEEIFCSPARSCCRFSTWVSQQVAEVWFEGWTNERLRRRGVILESLAVTSRRSRWDGQKDGGLLALTIASRSLSLLRAPPPVTIFLISTAAAPPITERIVNLHAVGGYRHGYRHWSGCLTRAALLRAIMLPIDSHFWWPCSEMRRETMNGAVLP